jgi:pilus assembly protein CpaB
MKNKRAFLMMALAVLFGLAAVVLASRWMQSKTASSIRRVVVAVNDVSRGQKLLPEMLTLADWRAGDLPKDAFTDLSKLTDRVLKAGLVRGEPLAEGKRAITVRVNDVIGVAGFALPGNFVDIIVHTERDPVENEKVPRGALHISKIVLERILVLAVAQEVSRDETKPKVVNAVTLEVTPEQAETLDLARGVGTLSLALRNQTDQAAPDTAGATKRSVLDLVEPVIPPKPVAVAAKGAPARVHTVAAAAPAPVVVQAKRDCVSVINGVHTAQECF